MAYSAPSVHNRPLWRTAWRRLRRRPFQYVLFILGVALGVAMMVSIDLASGSASRAFALSTSAITGEATHRIVGDAAGLDEQLYTRLRTELGFAPAAPVVEGYVLAQELGEQPMRLLGVDLFAEPPFRSYFGGEQAGGIEGIIPFLVQPNTVILSQPLADEYGLALGDDITLVYSGRPVTMQIVGLLEPADDVNRRALANIIFTDVATAQTTLEMVGRLSHVDLIAADDAALAPVRDLLPVGVRVEEASARSNAVQQMTAAFELNLTALSLLALVVGMFLIYNTVSFSVVQRRPLFGVLRCLGVTSGQLFTLIIFEAVLLSLIGAALGLALGVVLGRGMVGLVTQTINDLYFVVNVQDVDVSLWSLVKGLLIGVGAAMIASAVPAWEAMRTTPNATLRRSTIESRAQKMLPWLVVAWLALGGIGAGLLWIQGVSLVVAFAGLFAVLLAFALLTAPVTAVFMRAITPAGQRLVGVLGRMAPRDIVRSLSRTSVAIAALMIAVSVIIGVSIMIGSFRQTVTIWLNDTLQADVFISPPSLTASTLGGALDQEVVNTVAAWPGIDRIIPARQTQALLPDRNRTVNMLATAGDVSNGARQYLWQDGDLDAVWARFLAGDGVIVTEPFLRKENLSLPPGELTLATPQGDLTLPILAVAYDYASEQGTVFLDLETYRAIWQDETVSTMAAFVAPGADVDAVTNELQAAFSGRSDVVVQSNEGLRHEALVIFDRTFAITSALQLLAVVVAFIGVLSALMSLQLERARELGVLRATGMTLRQLWRLTLLETGLMGGTAGLLAMPTGFILAWILIYVINLRSFGWTLQMRLETADFVQAFLVALVAALLAGIYPALRLGRMVVATAIRQE